MTPTQPTTSLTGTAVDADDAWRELHRRACAPYRAAGRFAWYFARGKLGRDPMFRAIVEHGDLPPHARVLDLGCGQALLAALLQACDEQQRSGRWPPAWAPAPVASAYTGIDLTAAAVERARRALAAGALQPQLRCADLRTAPLPPCDVAVLLDVLHYLDADAQDALLLRVRDALSARGRLLLRIGDAAQRGGVRLSKWVDRVVCRLHGSAARPQCTRSVAQWTAQLTSLGFHVQARPMSAGTPFANVLLVADRA